jgi:hypothetical protein
VSTQPSHRSSDGSVDAQALINPIVRVSVSSHVLIK